MYQNTSVGLPTANSFPRRLQQSLTLSVMQQKKQFSASLFILLCSSCVALCYLYASWYYNNNTKEKLSLRYIIVTSSPSLSQCGPVTTSLGETSDTLETQLTILGN